MSKQRFSRTLTRNLLTGAVAAAALAACGDITDSGTPVYVIELDDGSSLELWDQGGLPMLSGTNPVGVSPLYQRYDLSGTPAQIFAELRPDEPVPAELAALTWPAREPGARPANAPERNLTAQGFQNKYCTIDVITQQPVRNDAKRHIGDCQVNWQGGRWARFNNKQEVYGAVNPTAGSVTFRRSSKFTNQSSFTVTDWTVAVGFERWANTFMVDDRGVDGQFEVLDASGDTFHVSTVYADKTICWTNFFCDINSGWVIMHQQCDDGRELSQSSGNRC